MKTHTIQRLRQAENTPQCVACPQTEPLIPSVADTKTPPRGHSGPNLPTVEAPVALREAGGYQGGTPTPKIATAGARTTEKRHLVIEMDEGDEAERLRTLLRDVRREAALVHDELYPMRHDIVYTQTASFNALLDRLAIIACQRP